MKPNYIPITITVNDVLDDKKFLVPSFQRNVVWKQGRRKDFIKNVRNGDPFGVILVRQNDSRYELIDGLQRITTLKNYLLNPYEYLDFNDVSEDLVTRLYVQDLLLDGIKANENAIKGNIPKIRKRIFELLSSKLKNHNIMSHLRNEFSFKDVDLINDIIDDICETFRRDIDISTIQIMAIDYKGPEENIPNVFYNLNTGGVQLSKYETYAALWSKPLFKINDESILNQIENKYEKLREDSDLDVDYNPVSLRTEGISLFEYCYALSSLLRDKSKGYHHLVGEFSKNTDPLGFEILTIVLGFNVNRADLIYNQLKNCEAQFLISLKNVIIEAFSIIHNSLINTVVGLGGQKLTSDNTYMIYHMVTSLLSETYNIDIANQKISKKTNTLRLDNFRKWVRFHYIHDSLSDFWRINRQVSDLMREIQNENQRRKYWFKISDTQWDITLSTFLITQKNSSKTISYNNKLFIDFLTKLRIDKDKTQKRFFEKSLITNEGIEYDFEHIIPKKIIEKSILGLTKSSQNTYPISSIGNVCYLSRKLNRSKKDKTIYDYKDDRPEFTYDSDFLKVISFPKNDQISFVSFVPSEFRIKYEIFIEKRAKELVDDFSELIKNYD